MKCVKPFYRYLGFWGFVLACCSAFYFSEGIDSDTPFPPSFYGPDKFSCIWNLQSGSSSMSTTVGFKFLRLDSSGL